MQHRLKADSCASRWVQVDSERLDLPRTAGLFYMLLLGEPGQSSDKLQTPNVSGKAALQTPRTSFARLGYSTTAQLRRFKWGRMLHCAIRRYHMRLRK